MPNEFELALMAASDRLVIDAAVYRERINIAVMDGRAGAMMAGMEGGRRHALKALAVSRGRVLRLMEEMLESLNYKHQVYIAEELGALGGVTVNVTRGRGEVRMVTVAGKTAAQWVNEIFHRCELAVKRVAMKGGDATRAVDDLSVGVLRAVMVFASIVDLDNKVRTVEAMTQAVSIGN